MGRLACCILVLGIAGCTVRAREPVAYVETTAAPAYVDLHAYPSTFYEGRTVYLINDRWMYPDRGRWYTYQVEPAPLQRQRPYVRSAPPAPPRAYPPSYPQSYPPSHRRY